MKPTLTILAILLLAIGGLIAQNNEEYEVELTLNPAPETPVSVYFGLYVKDLDFPQAHALGYKYLYGILVTGVTNGSPADMAGLLANDIIMEIDGKPVTNLEEFDRQRAGMTPGQEISIRVWRNVEITDIALVLQPRPEGELERKEIRKEIYLDESQSRPGRKKDIGWGGGGWVPYWLTFPVDDVNTLINHIGDTETVGISFDSDPVSDKGVFMHGGAGKGHIGNGIFVGGVGAGYEFKDTDPATNASIKYEVSFGGATLEKRFLIAPGFAASLGLMFGAGGHVAKYSQTQSDFTWPNVFTDDNFTATLKREYFVVQPRVELMVNLVSWLSLRAEVGYVYGLPTSKGWKVDSNTGDDFTITDSPDTPFQGLSFSVGPWIGF